jgi:hypothetical protein
LTIYDVILDNIVWMKEGTICAVDIFEHQIGVQRHQVLFLFPFP